MKEKILQLLKDMNNDSKSFSYKAEKELCEILNSVLKKRHEIRELFGESYEDEPVKISDITPLSFIDVNNCLPEIIECNECYEEFKT